MPRRARGGWTTANGEQADPQDGHCIVKVKADGQSLDTWVTWGALQESTLGWTSACLDEAWAVVTSEDQVPQLDLKALMSDIDALHGTGGNQAHAHSFSSSAVHRPGVEDVRPLRLTAENGAATRRAW